MDKKIINFTPTGTQTTRENSYAPLTPSEIVEEVHEAYTIGITSVHVHARDSNLENTYDKNVYREIIEGIRKHCPDLSICVSLTGRLFPEFEKRSEVLELKPDMGSLTMSSINFPRQASINEPDIILRLVEKMHRFGVIPEIECFDSGMLNYAKYLVGKKLLEPPYYVNVIFGNLYNAQLDLPTVASIVTNKIGNSLMCFGGIGNQQLKANALGLMYADGVRVGLEDNLYFTDKTKATNIKLLSRVHNLISQLGYEIIRPNEFMALGFKNKKLHVN
jgi:uncharacterized protein (DUF849 family)